MTKPLRLGIWTAVSSQAQATDDKVSLKDQEQAGQRFAKSTGASVVATYRVPGHTRDYVFWHEAEQAMPAYRQVRQDLEAHRLDIIHTVDADRLGRDPALISQFYSLAQRHGCEIYDASMPHVIGQQSIGHRYGVAVKSVAAGEDQRRRVLRQRQGMKGRINRGLIAIHPPTGYSPIRDPESGAVIGYEFNSHIYAVDFMTDLFLRGHSYSEITNRLNASRHKPPKAKQWSSATIWSILNNDTYAGRPRWGAFQTAEPTNAIPVRWDAATHMAIIRQRESRKLSGWIRRGAGPLTGVALCQRCGGIMHRYQATYKGNTRFYLYCGRHRRLHNCHHNNIPELRVLQEVAAFLKHLTTPEIFDRTLAAISDNTERTHLGEKLKEAQQRSQELDRQRERLAHAFAAGNMRADMYHRTDEVLLGELETIQDHITQLEQKLTSVPDPQKRRERLQHLVLNREQVLSHADPPEVATMLRNAGIHVYIENNKVRRVVGEL